MSTADLAAAPGRRGPGRPRAQEVSDAITSATIALLAERGVEAVTIDAIAARAGVGRHSIYRRWPSLDDLIADVMVLAVDREVPIPDTGSVRSDLLKAVEELVAMLDEPLGRASVALVGYAASHPEALPGSSPPQEHRRRLSRVIVERAVQRGELPAGTDPDVVLDLVVAPVWLKLLVWRQSLDTLDVVAIVDTVLEGARNGG